jgi:dual specificity tyrosine-phosphorylation-regulated kinase 2/3/4
MVAIKVIRNKKRFQYQAGVELKLLKYLSQKDKNDEHNIVRIIDYEIFRKHLLLSFELLSMNLYEFIK